MPELPEVETIARNLRARSVGERVVGVQVFWPRIVAMPTTQDLGQMVGCEIAQVTRRGKYVVFELQPHGFLLVHLRMSGRLLWLAPEDAARTVPEIHTHVVVHLASGAALRYRDPRKFGRFYLVEDPQVVLGALGDEPLEEGFTAKRLRALLQGRSRRIKPLLLDQHVLAGLGNIYVDEALWLARIYPMRSADSLTEAEITSLHAAIQSVLLHAVALKGTTLRDYRDADGQTGENQEMLAVYGRTGEPCKRCGEAIARMVVAQRGTHYCPKCQRVG